MRKKLLSVFMAFAIFFMSQLMTSRKSEALVGYAFKSKVVRTIGGIGIGAGATTFGIGLIIATVGSGWSALGWAFITLIYGPVIAALGLIVLDDNTVVDLEYQPIDLLDTKAHSDFSLETIQMYNAEVEELNAIRKTVQNELVEKSNDPEAAKKLWDDYSQSLHPFTVQVAEKKAAEFILELRKVHNL